MPATRAEIAEHVGAAFGQGRVIRDELVAIAANSGARQAVLQALARLPKGPFDDVRQLWPSLPGVPVDTARGNVGLPGANGSKASRVGRRSEEAVETPVQRSQNQFAATMSGATLISISIDHAAGFLGRLDERAPDPTAVAFGAYEDEHTLIGVAALGNEAHGRASVTVVVAPSRRRLKVGSDLLQAIIAEAAVRGVRCLLASYPDHATAADTLARSFGFARRRGADGEVTALVAVPEVH